MRKLQFTLIFTMFFSGIIFAQVGIISNVKDSMGYFNTNKISKFKTNLEYSLNFSLKNVTKQYFKQNNIAFEYYDFDFSKLNELKNLNDSKIIEELSLFCTQKKIEDLIIFRKILLYDSFYTTDIFFHTEHNYSIFTVNSYNINKAFFFSNFMIFKFNNKSKILSLPKRNNKINLNSLQLEKFEENVYDIDNKKLTNPKVEEYYMTEFSKTIMNSLDYLLKN